VLELEPNPQLQQARLRMPSMRGSREARYFWVGAVQPDEIDAAAAQRMLRQQVLYDTSKTFEFVITEAALCLLLCPLAAMLAQLDRPLLP